MTDAFEKEVIERLAELRQDVKSIQANLAENYKILHGNGHPGLVSRVTLIENNWAWTKWLAGLVGGIIGFIVSLATRCIFN